MIKFFKRNIFRKKKISTDLARKEKIKFNNNQQFVNFKNK